MAVPRRRAWQGWNWGCIAVLLANLAVWGLIVAGVIWAL